MPDDRRAWHRGGACLFIVSRLRRGRTTCPRETSMCRVSRCAGSAETIHHPMEHGLTRRVVDSPYSTFHRLVAEGVCPEGRTGRHAAQYTLLLRPTCCLASPAVLEAEINPLIVKAAGEGVVAVDGVAISKTKLFGIVPNPAMGIPFLFAATEWAGAMG